MMVDQFEPALREIQTIALDPRYAAWIAGITFLFGARKFMRLWSIEVDPFPHAKKKNLTRVSTNSIRTALVLLFPLFLFEPFVQLGLVFGQPGTRFLHYSEAYSIVTLGMAALVVILIATSIFDILIRVKSLSLWGDRFEYIGKKLEERGLNLIEFLVYPAFFLVMGWVLANGAPASAIGAEANPSTLVLETSNESDGIQFEQEADPYLDQLGTALEAITETEVTEEEIEGLVPIDEEPFPVEPTLNIVEFSLRFPSGSASLNGLEDAQVQELFLFLTEHNIEEVQVVGFADPRGESQSNRELSIQRAEVVAELLRSNGLPEPSSIKGNGEEDWSGIESPETFIVEERFRQERRVEVLIEYYDEAE